MASDSLSTKINPPRPRKRPNVDTSNFKRARDGSAFTRCEACKKDIPIAIADMHVCQRHGKKVKDPNRPKREELRKKSKIDRLSALPDNILACNVLSRLSLRDVVRTSVLSTRWRSMWKQIPHLDFTEDFWRRFRSLKSLDLDSWSRNKNRLNRKVKYVNDIIDNILLHHSGHIERFSIHVTFSRDILERLHIEQWVHHAVLKEVKHMSLKSPMYAPSEDSIIDIPPSLFACRLLRDLELRNFRFRGIPTEFDGFRSLQSCSVTQLHDLMDDELEQLIRLCPLLHKLVLVECSQLGELKIQAPNLRSLNIEHFYDLSLTANCPQLVELVIENFCSLSEFKLNSCAVFYDPDISDVPIPKEHPMLNSLRKLSVKRCFEVSGLTLLPTLGCFRNLEEVHIQIEDDCYSEHERATGETVFDSTFPSLKKVCVDVSSALKKEEAIMLTLLLNNAPSLNTIIVTLPYCPKHIHDKEFTNKVLDLQQIYEKVDIRMKIDEYRYDATCRRTYGEYGNRPYKYSNSSDEYSDSSESSDYPGSGHFGSDDDALSGPLDFSPSIFLDYDALSDEY